MVEVARRRSGALGEAEFVGRERHGIAADPPHLRDVFAMLFDKAWLS